MRSRIPHTTTFSIDDFFLIAPIIICFELRVIILYQSSTVLLIILKYNGIDFYFQKLKCERYRLNVIVRELDRATAVDYQTALVAFINCLIISAPRLSDRTRLRNEFIGKCRKLVKHWMNTYLFKNVKFVIVIRTIFASTCTFFLCYKHTSPFLRFRGKIKK